MTVRPRSVWASVAKLVVFVALGAQLVGCGGGGDGGGGDAEPAITFPDGRRLVIVAGNGTTGFAGDGGPATKAKLFGPYGLAWDEQGNLYIGQYYRISRVDASSGVITTVAGTGEKGYSGDGGPATKAKIGDVLELAFDPQGNLYFADSNSNVIRRIDTDGVITTVAGNGAYGLSPDGTRAVKASLAFPYGVAVGPDGKIYFSDGHNHRVRTIEPNGTIATVAGTGEQGLSGDGGPARKADLTHPRGLAFDEEGNLYIGTHGGGRVRMVDTQGVISTVVKADVANIDLSPTGDLYINHWKVDLSKWSEQGLEVIFEGGSYPVKVSGAADTTLYVTPWNFGVDPEGRIFISDDSGARVYRVEFR